MKYINRLILIPFIFSCHIVSGQQVQELKKLSLEELLDIEVTLVSRQPQKLTEVASAIQILTNEDIIRSTATRLPEALRLLPNLQMARYNSYATIVSARGFNTIFANKLLVMIDGRSVYSPLFAGVFWDMQNVLLEDIESIEAISGPGGTSWGVNAVNGVINIRTKSSEETQGLYVNFRMGNYLNYSGAIRYGGRLSKDFTYRVFVQQNSYNTFLTNDDQENNDEWRFTQGGFRIDGSPSLDNEIMIQGNFYTAKEFTVPQNITMDGQNLLASWKHQITDESNISIKGYLDRTWRKDVPGTIADLMETYDYELNYGFKWRKRHSILTGLGARLVNNKTINYTTIVGFVPREKFMPVYSAYIQDEISLLNEKLKLTLGSKFQHNVYSGFEILPNIRTAFTPNESHTFWGAISRAVRAPSRFDVDYFIPTYPVPPGTPTVNGGPNFTSEKLIAYEAGYRFVHSSRLLLSLASFYNVYNDVYSVEALPQDTVRYQIQNGTEGESQGIEVSGIFKISKSLKIRTGYTFFHKELRNKPGRDYDFHNLGHDPSHQALIQTMFDIPGNFQFDLTYRYVSELKNINIPSYMSLNVRLAWRYKYLEISANGRDLLKDSHFEFNAFKVPRSYYGQITWRINH